MTSALLATLRCPVCAPSGKGKLDHRDDGQLVCGDCGATYPIRDGIPILLTPEGDFFNILGRKELTNG